MKRLITILLLAISGFASAQTYQLNYPDIRVGNSNTGKIVLRGSNIQFPYLALGNTTDSVLTIAGGVIKKVPRSQFSGGGGGAVNSVFGRTGDVVAVSTDYSAFYPLLTSPYNNPVWINTLAYSKITGVPAFLTTETDPIWSGVASTYRTKTQNDALYEPIFSKNTAFNKNFGTASGTVAEGNDSRINNGQTAFGWGNHASAGYAIDANVVHKTGNETIAGNKTFTGNINGVNSSISSAASVGTSTVFTTMYNDHYRYTQSGGVLSLYAPSTLTGNRVQSYQDKNGVVALLSDIPSISTPNLQSVTNVAQTTTNTIQVTGNGLPSSLGKGLTMSYEPTLSGSAISSYDYPLSTPLKLYINPSGGNVLIGTTTDNGTKFQVNGTSSLIGQVGVNGDVNVSGNVSANNLGSNTWTPTISNTSNISSSTAYQTIYSRVGNVITLSGTVRIATPATGATSFQINIPTSSAFTSVKDASGVASGNAVNFGTVQANTSNGNILISCVSSIGGVTQHDVFFTLQYIIK